MRHLFTLWVLAFSLASCGKSKAPDTQRGSPLASYDASDIGSAGIDYASIYCTHVFKIKLRTDIKTELDLMCKDGKPTALFQEYRTKALRQKPGQVNVSFLVQKNTEGNDRSEFLLIWSFHSALRPYEVKARPLYDYIAKGYQNPEVSFQVQAQRLKDGSLDSGLHLWTTQMSYGLKVQALPTLAIINTRKTEYNLYQVLSGNEEMGLGVEHLTESVDKTYQASNLVNFSFNDGSGYNDGKGGTVIINILRFDFTNQGFPETAVKTMGAVAQGLAENMYQGLNPN